MELKNIRCLTTTAILIAVDIVLKFTLAFKLTETLKITFAFLALAAIGMLFGPVVSGLAGIITDVVGFFIRPEGAFNPLFTIVEMVGAIIYGMFLYGLKPLKFSGGDFTFRNVMQIVRIILAKLSVIIVCNLILTPAAMILSGYSTIEAISATYWLRIVKQLAQLPIDVVLLLVVLPGIMFAYHQAVKHLPQSRKNTVKTQ